VITRKGGKVVTIPLAPRTARAIDLAVGERVDGPVFCGPDGQRLDRHGAARVVRRVARRTGITKPVGPHTLLERCSLSVVVVSTPEFHLMTIPRRRCRRGDLDPRRSRGSHLPRPEQANRLPG